MKRIYTLLFLVSLTFVGFASGTETDYFIGKWNVTIKGTPGGDSKLVVDLKQEDYKLTGTVTSEKDGEVEIKEAELTDDGMVVSFKSGWFSVELLMKEKDANHCSCKLAGRYDGKSTRVNATDR